MFYLIALLGGLLLALFLIPKGNWLHEILHLPSYWLKISLNPKEKMQMERVFYGNHSNQYYLIFRSPDPAPKPPKVILYFHGGAWRFGRPEMFSLAASAFVSLGYVAILPSCRRTPAFAYPQIREDLTALIRHIDEHFQAQKPDYILGGMSSGGHLAAHLYYNLDPLKKAGFDIHRIKALLLLGAPLDLYKMMRSSLVSSFAGKRHSESFKQASVPTHFAKKESRPVLCIQGKKDGLVAFQSAFAFINTLEQIQEKGISFHLSPTLTHLETASWACNNHYLKKIITDWLEDLKY